MNQHTKRWSQVELGGHACHVYEPPTPGDHGYVIMYLHGVHLSALEGNTAFCDKFAQYGLPVIAPVTQRSWWTDRICEEFDAQVTAERHVLDRVMPYVKERWGAGPPRVALLGTSMGGQGALRFAFKHPNEFPIVAALSPAIDYQTRMETGEDETLFGMYRDPEEARQDTATLHVHPLNWPRNLWFCCCPSDYRWHESAERLRMKLSALGIPYECDLETPGAGHGFEYYNTMADAAVDFMFARLEQERRRLV